jgi:hypothetical protein
VLEELMLEARATKGRDLRSEVRRIRPGAFQDRHEDVVWLFFMAPHRYLVVDVTVANARTNTAVPQTCACLLVPGSLALEAQQGRLDAYLRNSALLGSSSLQSVHDYHPFALEGVGRLAHVTAELVVCLAILVAERHFLDMCAVDSRSLRSNNYVRMNRIVRRSTYVPFRRFWGMCGENSCNVFLLPFMVLCVPIFVMLYMREVPMLWHMFLGLRPAGFLLFHF